MYVDVVKFRQSLYNLLSNACKFTQNGTVSVEVAPVNVAGADWIEWRIGDTGIGIAPDQVQKLFRPFSQLDASTTRKYGGTGLGLAISQRFCELMGGAITVASEPGKGSTFTIRLLIGGPAGGAAAVNPPPSAVAAVEPAASDAPRSNTVLVIDDDPTVHDLLRRTLAREGFHVVVASSGEEGCTKPAKSARYAITLDVFMPGMDGWAVLNALKTEPDLSQVPVVLLTISDDRGQACLLGAAEVSAKASRARAFDCRAAEVPVEPDGGTFAGSGRRRSGFPGYGRPRPAKMLWPRDGSGRWPRRACLRSAPETRADFCWT